MILFSAHLSFIVIEIPREVLSLPDDNFSMTHAW
jgi:hypothetical protein